MAFGSPNRSALTKGSLGTMLVRGSYFPLGFLASLLLARYLGITELGVYSEALAWSSVIAVIGTVGLDRYAVREISGSSAQQSWPALKALVARLPLLALATAVGSALVAFVLFLVVRVDSNPRELETFAIAIAMAPVMSLAILRQGMLQGLGRVAVSRLPEDFLRPGMFVLVMLIAYGALGIAPDSVNAMLMQAATLGVAFLVGTWLLRRHLPAQIAEDAAPEELPVRILRSALPMGLFAAASALMLQVGVVALGFTGDPDQVALYATAVKIAIMVGLAEYAVNNTYQPIAAAMIASGDIQGLRRMAPRAGGAVLLLSLPITIPILALSEPILSLFGPEFLAGEATLRILAVSYVASQLFGQNATLLMMSKNVRPLVGTTSFAVLLIVVLNLLLAPALEAPGAAIAWLVTVIVWNAALAWQVRRTLGISASPFVLLSKRSRGR